MDLNDLQHKKKSVADLIRFISNTTRDDKVTPNFSVFLGSGASVTSGVRSGQVLVNSWMDECIKMENKDNLTKEEYFSPSHAPEWFDPANPYSSLFEHRYDLQRQRRIFVEHEVAGKTPSLGYAYLVNMIENGFFNTVFTTNFDDLLNEAFYQYSNNRPIVCAHDSSISGVSVTSDRPKVIKLHGDYLFDNIKTTLRETESLETNMRLKFQEFAKDYGLIVVGYSGQDRSIMDILTFLLQQEDYFKNGIYWCIRKGEENNVGSELKKLLWRERVFYVIIDGFDELMSELNYFLNDGKLPVDDQFLSHQHQVSIISKLTENPYIKNSDSQYLKDDCKKLNNRLSYNQTTDAIKLLKEKRMQESSNNNVKKSSKVKPNLTPLSKEQQILIEDISNEAFLYMNKNKARQKMVGYKIEDIPDSMFKLELLELYVDLNDDLTDADIMRCFEELIRLNPKQQKYYEIASNRLTDFTQSKEYLKRAVQAFPNDYYIINSYTAFILDEYDERMNKSDLDAELPNIMEMLNKSLSLNKSISNQARLQKADCINYLYKSNKDKRDEEACNLENEILDISAFHPNTLKVLKNLSSTRYNKKLIEDAIGFYLKADNPILLEECYMLLINWQAEKEGFDVAMETAKTYEKDFEPSAKYKELKFNLLFRFEYLTDALSLYDELKISEEVRIKKMEILWMLGKTDEMDSFYNSIKKSMEVKVSYLSCKNDWEALNSLFKEWLNTNEFVSEEHIIAYSYSLLQVKDYEGVERLLRPYYDNPICSNGVIVVNFLFARKMMGKNVDQKIKEKVIDNKYIESSEFEMAGAYGILKDRDKTLDYIKKILKKQPSAKYNIREWPILDFLKTDAKFQELMKSDHKTI